MRTFSLFWMSVQLVYQTRQDSPPLQSLITCHRSTAIVLWVNITLQSLYKLKYFFHNNTWFLFRPRQKTSCIQRGGRRPPSSECTSGRSAQHLWVAEDHSTCGFDRCWQARFWAWCHMPHLSQAFKGWQGKKCYKMKKRTQNNKSNIRIQLWSLNLLQQNVLASKSMSSANILEKAISSTL